MKTIENSLQKTRFIDYMFGFFQVILAFGYIPRNYQENALTIFVIFCILVYELGKLCSRKIRTSVIKFSFRKLKEKANYSLDIPAIAGTIHFIIFVIFMIVIA